MQILPRSERIIHQSSRSDSIIVGAHEHNGYIWWTKILLSDLPNDLVSLGDLKRVGINLVDMRPIVEK